MKKKIDIKQNYPQDKETCRKYRELLDKAEKYFQKEKFVSSKNLFIKASQIWETEEVLEKISVCKKNAHRLEKAQELLRRGYQLQKMKKLHDALLIFQQSLEFWDNREIRLLTEKLRSKLPKPSLAPAHKAEAEARYTDAIHCYMKALKYSENIEARNRLGICLVKQKDYDGAIGIFKSFN